MTISVWLQYLIKENYEHYKIYVYIIYILVYVYSMLIFYSIFLLAHLNQRLISRTT